MSAEWDAVCVEGDHASIRSPALAEVEAEIFEHVKGSWCSEQKAKLLIELVVLTRPGVCVEIGAFSGSTTLPILAGLRHLGSGRGYVVEAWSNAEAIRGLPSDDAHTSWWQAVDMATVRSQFDQMLESWSLRPWCEVIAEPSGQAWRQLPGIDLLHLDGNFSPEGAALDSEQYLPKVAAKGHVVLSNALATVGGRPTKMRALWPLFDACDIVCEVDGGNTLLFRKR
jgi:hypothetical protein